MTSLTTRNQFIQYTNSMPLKYIWWNKQCISIFNKEILNHRTTNNYNHKR